jgi:GNAT superfamily N-acetyltransferase
MTLFPPPRCVDERDVTVELDRAIRAGLCECFPPDFAVFSRTRAWHGSHPAWSVVVEHETQVIAHAGIVERVILAGRQAVRVAGVQNMFVLPRYRGQGLFPQVMAEFVREALRRRLDLGLLFCTPQIAVPYARLGWQFVHARRITRIDEQGEPQPLPANNVAMRYPLGRAELPAGDVHLQGNDW